MQHVFVETNWIVECLMPAFFAMPAATQLLERARAREVQIYVPSICIAEARHPLNIKFSSFYESDRLRQFLQWARIKKEFPTEEIEIGYKLIEGMEGKCRSAQSKVNKTLEVLAAAEGVRVIPFSEDIATWYTELCFKNLNIKPYDLAVLACVLSYGHSLRNQGCDESFFCEVDSDLQPWHKDRQPKQPLASLYDDAAVWVYGDFLLGAPEKPASWSEARKKRVE